MLTTINTEINTSKAKSKQTDRRQARTCTLENRMNRGVTREGHEGRAHPPPPPPWKFRLRFLDGALAWRDHCFPAPFSWFLLNADLSWRPEDHFCKLFVIEMSPERHEKAKEDHPFRGVLALAYSRDRAYNLWLIMPVSDRDNLLLCLWPSKRKPRHCGESTGKSDQDSVTKYHQFRSVAIVVDSNPAVADF